MVSLSSRISPRTSTVIFLDKSPFATAIVTSAMLRTWAVRFEAIELTESVRSFQTPLTFLTWAWPPSFPSEPTSRATRVTSEVKTLNWPIIVLTIRALFKNSPSSGRPSTSRLTVWVKSPLATAAIERVTSVIGQTRSEMSVLTDSSMPRHAPALALKETRWRILPSLPTALLTRLNSRSMLWLDTIISLNKSEIFPSTPIHSEGSRAEKSPLRADKSALRTRRLSKGSAKDDASTAGLTAGFLERLGAWDGVCGAEPLPFFIEGVPADLAGLS